MSHAKAKKPENPGTDQSHTHEHLVAKSLTIKDAPDSAMSVQILTMPHAAGIWVSSGRGQETVGLVTERGIGPYLLFWGEHAEMHELPPLAICPDRIQVPDKTDRRRPVAISFDDLLKAIRQVVKPDAV